MRIEAAFGGAGKRVSCCAFWPFLNGHTIDPEWGFEDGGQRVCLGASATLGWEV